MPVLPTDSPSPDRFERSPTPDPADSGPVKKRRVNVEDIQRYKVEKLMSNIDREVRMPVPQGPFASELLARMPKDIIKSVSGSAAAAGSGEFHVYKNSRRREFERVKLMEEQQRALAEQRDFKERQAAREAEAEAKTARNRAKRQKRKASRRGGAGGGGGNANSEGTTDGATITSKLAAAANTTSQNIASPVTARSTYPGVDVQSVEGAAGSSNSGTLPVATGVEIRVLDDD